LQGAIGQSFAIMDVALRRMTARERVKKAGLLIGAKFKLSQEMPLAHATMPPLGENDE
jgi:hypothetical protein